MRQHIFYASFTSPFGTVCVAATGRGVTDVAFTGDTEGFARSIEARCVAPVEDPARLKAVVKELKLYLSGKLKGFSVRVDLEGSPFEKAVWAAISSIPRGETRSYLWIAKKIKRPKSVRAVGNACGKNPVPVIIPCHRVLKSDGSLGGYSGGVGIKERLLELEGVKC